MLTILSTLDKTIASILMRVEELQSANGALDAAMHSAADEQLSLCRDRIHTRGIASDGSDIGQYSSTPMYVDPNASPGTFQPVGKTGRTVFASTGKPHLTKYFDQGYKQFRQEAGLANDKVTLTLRGDLRDQLTVIKTSAGYGLGWTDDSLYELSQQLERKYSKPIWAPTAGERYLAVEAVEIRVREAMK